MNSPIASSKKKFPIVACLAIAGALFVLPVIVVLLFGSPTVAFDLQLDDKPLPLGVIPVVTMNGKPFHSGEKVAVGHNSLSVILRNAQPINLSLWTFWGTDNLGSVSLKSLKGSLRLTSNPSSAAFTLRQGSDSIRSGITPTTLDSVPVGDYDVLVSRGGYKESRAVTIAKGETAALDLNLKIADIYLESSPTDAEFTLTGNGNKWEGKLPTVISNVTFGKYTLTGSRKGWDIVSSITVDKTGDLTNHTKFTYASIAVTSDPIGLAISTNRVEIGKTPIVLYELKPGQYALTASDGENDLLVKINVGPKEAVKTNFVFRYGTVQLATTPAGATVFRKGKEIGKTPLTLTHIPVGESFVELRLDGHVSTNLAISASSSSTANLTVKLTSEALLSALKQARGELDAGRLEEAQKAIAAALKIDPNDPTATALQNDQVKATANAETSRKEAENIEAKKVIERAIAATGGKELLITLKAYQYKVNASGTDTDGNTYTSTATTYKIYSEKIKVDHIITTTIKPKVVKLLGGFITATMDQADTIKSVNEIYCITTQYSWSTIRTPYGVQSQTMTSEFVRNRRSEFKMDKYYQLFPLLQNEYQFKKQKTYDSPDNSTTIIAKESGSNDVYLHFDNNSGLLVGIDYFVKDTYRLKRYGERYSNFHLIGGGIQNASTVQYYTDGVLTETAQVVYAQALTSLPDSVFLQQ